MTEAEAKLISDEVDEILLNDSFRELMSRGQAGRPGCAEAQGAIAEARSRPQSIISTLAAAWFGLSWSRQNQTVTMPERPRICVSRGPDRTPSGAP